MKQNIITGIVPGTGSGTTTDKEAKLTATNLYFNYNDTTMTMSRDSKSQPFRLYKRKYINVTYSDHTGTGKRYKEGIALYNERGDSLIEVITTSAVYSTVTTSAIGDLSQFGKDVSDSRSGYSFGKNLTGTYRIVPVCQVQGSEEWMPMLATDRYYAVVNITSTTATLTAHPISTLKTTNYSFSGDATVGSPEQVTVTIYNEGPDRYFGDLYLWIDGEQIDEYGGYTTTLQAEVPAGGSTDVTFNFTPTAAGTKSVQVSTDDQGSKMLSGTGTIVITSEEVKPMNLAVAIAAEGADADGNVYDNTVRFKVDITNKGGSTYRKYVLAPLFICSKDENGKVTGGKMVTYKQSNLKLSPGETQTLYFTFDNLAYGSTYALNIYARNENDSLKNVVKSGESKYYTICRGMTVWESDGTRYGVKAAGNITIPDKAAAVRLEGLTISSVTPNSNPNCLYFIGSEEQTPTGLSDKNIIKGSKAESIRLSDGYDFYTPSSVEASSISYTRKVNRTFDGASGWETIVLPFAATSVTADGKAVAWRTSATDADGNLWICNYTSEDDDTLYFSCAPDLKANIPYLIALGTNGAELKGKELTFSATDAVLVPDVKAITSGSSVIIEGTWVDSLQQKLFYIDLTGDKLTWYTSQQVPAFRAFARGIEDGSNTNLQIVIEGLDGINVPMNFLKDHLYRTFSYSRDLSLPDGVKAYAVYSYSADGATEANQQPGKLYLRQLKYVPANMGVLLVADIPTGVTLNDTEEYSGYRLTFLSPTNALGISKPTTTESNISDRDNIDPTALWTVSHTGDKWNNYLVPTLNEVPNLGNATVEDGKITYRYFALSEYSLTKSGKAANIAADSKDNYVGFFRLTEKGASNSNHAYLALPTDNASDVGKATYGFLDYNGQLLTGGTDGEAAAKQNTVLVFDDLEGNTTGISTVSEAEAQSGVYYNLQGIRVLRPTKGIYIHQGKKVIVK